MAETISELKKVTWPSRPEATRLTIMVILISIAIGFMLGIIDIGFSQLFNRFIFGGR
ncbi:MAG: preprotein translocase subunit SecE [Chloroflexi bacterium]|nr:preprotein translocase subunit SecE [Chloroflexota bacterium]